MHKATGKFAGIISLSLVLVPGTGYRHFRISTYFQDRQ